jgi:hypothetical protein
VQFVCHWILAAHVPFCKSSQGWKYASRLCGNIGPPESLLIKQYAKVLQIESLYHTLGDQS